MCTSGGKGDSPLWHLVKAGASLITEDGQVMGTMREEGQPTLSESPGRWSVMCSTGEAGSELTFYARAPTL